MIRQIIISLIVFLSSVSLFAQEPFEHELNAFSRLVVTDRIIVRLVESEKESVVIKAQGVNYSSVQTEISENTLTIGINGELFAKKKVVVTLNYIKIDAINVNGGADVSTTSLFKSDSLTVELRSGGMLYLNADIGYLDCKIAEGALLTAEGHVNKQNIVVSVSGTLSAFNLKSEIIKVKASSGGKAKVYAVEELDAEASSNGYISYKGNPSKINRIVSSGGIVTAYKP